MQQAADWNLQLFRGTFNVSIMARLEHLILSTMRTFKNAVTPEGKILKKPRKDTFGFSLNSPVSGSVRANHLYV